ncbi:MAG: 1-(5-phosphoribosyl)-5-[(5-phosphoribosylamino)methylideneamino] imidazole-4-carboxamide isomerase [Opitutia bacterium UBA7350]|nr:MAG: 1-(5-phosphoribosyl)-5-[(5-phosphoribosylamino)methylideneamino] imidazole-4-carboxamide isomerase [Opitutae bacterium UBA7350]
MTQFRPCIDLHEGKVKQIVGGSLREDGVGLETNFVSESSPDSYAARFANDKLLGGHIIQLGAGNELAAKAALKAYQGGLQIGGGISKETAAGWLYEGASHVIVTSEVFTPAGHFDLAKLDALKREVGSEHLVMDLSCRGKGGNWTVAMNRWQTLTDLKIAAPVLEELSGYCAEFLVHAVDVEGKCAGIDEALVEFLGLYTKIPTTYAGGARHLEDLELVKELSIGAVDLCIGSALDIFGGTGVKYADCLAWNRTQKKKA